MGLITHVNTSFCTSYYLPFNTNISFHFLHWHFLPFSQDFLSFLDIFLLSCKKIFSFSSRFPDFIHLHFYLHNRAFATFFKKAYHSLCTQLYMFYLQSCRRFFTVISSFYTLTFPLYFYTDTLLFIIEISSLLKLKFFPFKTENFSYLTLKFPPFWNWHFLPFEIDISSLWHFFPFET